jgi:hypothetical protein
VPLLIACVPIALMWLHVRGARQQAKDRADFAATALAKAAAVAEAAAKASRDTSVQVEQVRHQLDGRLTMFMKQLEKRITEATR